MNNWRPFDFTYIEKHNPNWLRECSRHFVVSPLIIEYLLSKGIDDPEEIYRLMYPNIFNDLHNPLLLKDLEKACIRIKKALLAQEKILIFGDYDCDGMTATALMYMGLKQFGAKKIIYRCPLRSEGYGLSEKVVEECEENTSLIITVDNGTSSHEALAVAKRRGIDVIVTDHHEILGCYPNCYAFINPHRTDSRYPFPSLCGAGIALKIIQALYMGHNKSIDDQAFWNYIQIAALATIADLMPIQGENHSICKFGLKMFKFQPSSLFKQLFESLRVKHIDSSTISFSLAPIFNAIGRLDDPNKGVELLVKENVTTDEIDWLINLNNTRKLLTSEHFVIADSLIQKEGLNKDPVIVVYDQLFHNGIIGIIAGKIVQKYKRPAIVVSGTGIGSARSVSDTGFSIINVIQKSAHFLKKFGGHEAAAGFSINLDQDFLELFRREVCNHAINEPFKTPYITYIDELHVSRFSDHLYADFQCIEPFGQGFEKPLFYCKGPITHSSLFGKANNHLKLNYGRKQAIGFFKGHLHKKLENGIKDIHMIYTPFNPLNKSFLIHDLYSI